MNTIATAALAASLFVCSPLLAEGTEALGPLTGVKLAQGSDILTAGVGLRVYAAGLLSVEVPAGATVKQVLVYWESLHSSATNGDAKALIEGLDVVGTRIGGATHFWGGGTSERYSSTWRADITSLGLIKPGSNSIKISKLYDDGNWGPADGAGLVVVIDDGSKANLQARDGNDCAHVRFEGNLKVTTPVVFPLDPRLGDRDIDLFLMVGDVSGTDRPNQLHYKFDTEASTTIVPNPFGAFDGLEFDSRKFTLKAPAGATSLTVQVVSDYDQTQLLPSSLVWLFAGLKDSVPAVVVDSCPKNASWWKTNPEAWVGTGLLPTTTVEAAFKGRYCSFPSHRYPRLAQLTLQQALGLEGSWRTIGASSVLLREGVASLLNARHPKVRFLVSSGWIVCYVDRYLAYGNTWCQLYLASKLAYFNNLCSSSWSSCR